MPPGRTAVHRTTLEGAIHLMVHSPHRYMGQGLSVVTSALYLVSASYFDGLGKVCVVASECVCWGRGGFSFSLTEKLLGKKTPKSSWNAAGGFGVGREETRQQREASRRLERLQRSGGAERVMLGLLSHRMENKLF